MRRLMDLVRPGRLDPQPLLTYTFSSDRIKKRTSCRASARRRDRVCDSTVGGQYRFFANFRPEDYENRNVRAQLF